MALRLFERHEFFRHSCMKNWLKLLISLALPLAVGAIAGLFTQPEIDSWYKSIQKPSWQPPNSWFGPVWTTLYALMGFAFFLVWKADASPSVKRPAITLYLLQLALNFLWSFIFFNQHQIGWALVDIIALWVLILLTIFAFARISKLAAWLLVPYISWVSFASILNFAIFQLN